MVRQNVYIEISGEQVKVGTITGRTSEDAVFRYLDEYVSSPEGRPISVSLPFREAPFSPRETRNFFSGLLPEGFMRKRVSELAHVGAGDYTEILADLGSECIGALRIEDERIKPPERKYIRLEHNEIKALAGEGVVEATELVMKAHLSLTGASGKVGLYKDPDDGSWYLPVGDAPSTHIIKQSHIRLGGIVTNEQLCLMTAEKLGISVPESFIIGIDEQKDSQVLLAARRFDRIINDKNHVLDGHVLPYRLHQEDFAQALGIPAENKYDVPGGDYLARVFSLILNYSSEPLEDQISLWDIVVFDYLAGNTDNHIKNLSLLYSADLKSLRLAPAYDMLSTSVYEMSTDNMAFSIGGEMSVRDITRDSFRKAAKEAGLNPRPLLKRFDRMVSSFEKALKESSKELTALGFVNAADICERILETGGIAGQ